MLGSEFSVMLRPVVEAHSFVSITPFLAHDLGVERFYISLVVPLESLLKSASQIFHNFLGIIHTELDTRVGTLGCERKHLWCCLNQVLVEEARVELSTPLVAKFFHECLKLVVRCIPLCLQLLA